MLIAILPDLLKFVLRLGMIFGLAFMLACTALVIYCIINGDIKISIVKSEDEKEEK
ncbi:hypothetical protein [Roseburia sp. 1XD42-69]|jgi:hypothetical protein|uniref:hypothetical protein n=1 Tax=Roseburia sp. 1XD42-69 TaxID=2320088 RepID=UPI001313F02C|nr:hypothetical protein [Roseburia sp. 1XD42-69]